ncbi:MAG: DUF1343 domain-containing protein [Bacilli bacterium]|jgi:uncharacterized protein YbbC (DUF1343 family)|nr:DUF1343 domain-containing protein [Bacilli bacterium]
MKKRALHLLFFLLLGFGIFLGGCSSPATVDELIIRGDFTIYVGDEVSLVTNKNNVSWETSDATVAMVQNGVVTGLRVGTVTITASLIADSTIWDEVQVEVKAKTTTQPPVEPPVIGDVDVKLGIDLIDDYLDFFAGKRVGLITNPTGINSDYESTIDVLFEKVNLVALFAPEHGIRGNLQAGAYIPSYTDEKTGLPVYSLYGSTKAPTPQMLENLDVLCIDIQDAGARFYTYIYTMAYAMEACAENDKEFVVFDRPNPIGGAEYEGNILNLTYRSFIGYYPILQRHGMTIAELAMLFNEEYGINCELTTILMDGWDRNLYYDDTDLPWVVPSPNFPTNETAVVYPGTCIFEGTNVSEGRGTTIPFEVIGAPFMDAEAYAAALNEMNLPGVIFRPAYFTPTFNKYTGEVCNGVQVHVTNRYTFKAVKTGWTMFELARTMYPSDLKITNATSSTNMVNLNTGANYITNDTYTLEQQYQILLQDTATFGLIREDYLLYE